jgi:hypothetical protein
MTENVKVTIDISTGNVGIECPETAFETILNGLADFIPKLASFRPSDKQENDSQSFEQPSQSDDAVETVAGNKRASKRKPLPVYKMTDLGVDDEAKSNFNKFFDSKGPRNQSDQLLLCAFWLNKTLKRETFTDDDAFTALRAAGVPKIPPRIESVISNLKLENKLIGERGKYRINHIGEDFVGNDLPPTAVKA